MTTVETYCHNSYIFLGHSRSINWITAGKLPVKKKDHYSGFDHRYLTDKAYLTTQPLRWKELEYKQPRRLPLVFHKEFN